MVYNGMADAPRDPEIAHEEWDAQRVRERVNDLRPQYGLRDYTVVARHDDTGELAALTEMSVDPANPGWGFQIIHGGDQEASRAPARPAAEDRDDGAARHHGTATRAHLDVECQDNEHMIAINEAMGYAVFGPPTTSYRLDVAAVPGLPG